MMPFLKKNRRWIMGGAAVILLLSALGWQLWGGEWAVRDSCLDGGGAWKDGACTFH